MKFIIDCPSCGKSLRFPLDKGKIKIRCICGYETVIDPDDTSIYKRGRFDLKPEDSPKKEKRKPVKQTGFALSRDSLIKKIYDFRYTMQNLKHMPNREKYRILLIILLPLILFAFIIYAFFGLLI